MKTEIEKKIVSIQLPVELINQVNAIADSTDSTFSRVIRLALKEYLKQAVIDDQI